MQNTDAASTATMMMFRGGMVRRPQLQNCSDGAQRSQANTDAKVSEMLFIVIFFGHLLLESCSQSTIPQRALNFTNEIGRDPICWEAVGQSTSLGSIRWYI